MQPVYNKLFNQGLKRHDKYYFSIHSIRHTVASQLAIQGESLIVIKEVLNHSSVLSTLVYAKLQNKSTAKALDNLYKS